MKEPCRFDFSRTNPSIAGMILEFDNVNRNKDDISELTENIFRKGWIDQSHEEYLEFQYHPNAIRITSFLAMVFLLPGNEILFTATNPET